MNHIKVEKMKNTVRNIVSRPIAMIPHFAPKQKQQLIFSDTSSQQVQSQQQQDDGGSDFAVLTVLPDFFDLAEAASINYNNNN